MHDIVFLLDVDNTLLDFDGVLDDLRRRLVDDLGPVGAERYWRGFEELRDELGYTDYLGALQRYRLGGPGADMSDPRLLRMASFLLDYPFAERLYPGALQVIAHLQRFGLPVILSDGDAVFQPRKVQRSGLWQAVDGRVLIYIHKELMLDAVQERYPARRYVMIDDKPRILSAMKAGWGERLTTVFPRQGQYALAPQAFAGHPAPDITIERIVELRQWPIL
ncbi:HAD family hydrolase [Variovorax ginsengisoli]|uniref:HAD family hydrolase n=1 Tax=Variovorax ginsengisoli TaxID=363844 RepID=A0ABT8RWJ6_9BURK|nr:HAD family hydrolase [Variovorax ginsengisoli]MDN8611831.1 HAD family hydrolase [Variovorax ginsengisoli]MDO1531001.1 HAD family hydrolase [Variovorax ginsengisoli]